VPAPEPGPPSSDDPEDGLPYGVTAATDRKCPVCGKRLPLDAVLCPACGFNFQTRQKEVRVYEPLEKHWEAGMSLRTRLGLFLLGNLVGAVPMAMTASAYGDVMLLVIPWVLLTVLLAFLLGTFIRIDVSRNEQGRARLKKTWRICFWTWSRRTLPWHESEAVVTGKTRDVSLLDWLVAACLLPMGLIPAVLWWWFFIQRDQFFSALARDHGFPAELLYRGIRQDQAEQIATVVSDATGLPWQRA
jgi:hypothetical protein